MSSSNGRLNHWRRLALANPWAFAASSLLGAALAFVYSYVPLHTVNVRKIERLEASVISKEVHIDGLARELAAIREGSADAPDAAQLVALTSERDEAVRGRELADKDAANAKRRVHALEGERAEWKRKIASLEKVAAKSAAPVAKAQANSMEPAAARDFAEDIAAEGVPAADASQPSHAIAGAAPPDEIVPAAPAP